MSPTGSWSRHACSVRSSGASGLWLQLGGSHARLVFSTVYDDDNLHCNDVPTNGKLYHTAA
jgi:hypothetical protein